MKTMPVAIVISASAVLVSLGWFGLQSINSAQHSSPAAPNLSSLRQAATELSGARHHASKVVVRQEGPSIAAVPDITVTENTRTSRPQASSTLLRQAGHPAPSRALYAANPPASTSSAQASQRASQPPASSPYLSLPENSGTLPEAPAVTFRGSSMIGYVDVELAPGTPVPVALSENRQDSSPAMIEAKEQIAQEFEEEIFQAAKDGTAKPGEIDKAWTEAQERADRRFRLFYGKDAYNRESLRAGQPELSHGRLP